MIFFVTDKEKDREKNPIGQIGTSDAQNAKRVELYTLCKTCRALQASTRLRI